MTSTLDGLSYEQACARARGRARRHQADVYVVYAGEGLYAIADEQDLDDWWLGATVHAAFGPDGQICD